MKTTKVVCPVCGAEMCIDNHESVINGTFRTIAKDSNLGTIYLPMKKASAKESINKIMELLGDNEELKTFVSSIAEQIADGGYLSVADVRRFITGHTLRMFYSEQGFHASLLARGERYSWRVVLDDLRRQKHFAADKDVESFRLYNHIYNKEVVIGMMQNLKYEIQKLWDNLKTHSCKGDKYRKLTCHLNRGKGVFENEYDIEIPSTIDNYIALMKGAKNIYEVYNITKAFKEWRDKFNLGNINPSYAFLNAFKMAGAYFTMKSLIQYDGLRIHVDAQNHMDVMRGLKLDKVLDAENSLERLNRKMMSIESSAQFGYTLLGFMREFLKYNNFDYQATCADWHEQTLARKAARISNKSRRPRN